MADLTILSTVKTYAGITGTADDAKLTALLTAASDAIENYCDRVFASASYVEYFDGRDNWRNGFLHLKQCPVTAITRIASYPLVVMTVKDERAATQMATIQVTAAGVTLTAIASGVSTTTNLTFVSYPTLTAMASAIAAAGFTATVTPTYENWPSAYLRQPQGALNCKLGGLSNGACLYLYERELSVASIDYDEGTIYGFFPEGFYQTEVRYTAGYATIPAAVQQACAIVTKALFDQSSHDQNLSSEKLGDYSWTRRMGETINLSNAIFADAIPLLAKYRRVRAM